ncbi:MAG: hypothetical protein JJU37_04325 [Balneolaceae bacterium]|nr:hypothetical protein [Balneolaceae bacterium]
MNLKRIQLERKIADAADGQLSEEELEGLKTELQPYPDLMQDFEEMMGLPDLTNLFGEVADAGRFHHQIESIHREIIGFETTHQSFEEVTIYWFKRYAVAASIAILALSSFYSLSTGINGQFDDDVLISDLFYSGPESDADEYVIYLEEISNQ